MPPNRIGLLWSLIILILSGSLVVADLPQLRVSEDGRYLATTHGSPFFYLGDTAWELFHRLDREEADLYLRDRAAKGFNVVQAVALAEVDGIRTPNAYGHTPLLADDPMKPDVKSGPENDYWDHVDYVIQRAAGLGIYTGLLPTWGDKWKAKSGRGPKVFTPDNARIYGRWLAERYRHQPIIWILGGDRTIDSDEELAIMRAMATGIREAVGHSQLIAFHPRGGSSSSKWLHQEDWLDFNMFQSSHGSKFNPNYNMLIADRSLQPVKPSFDGEPRYEDIPVRGKLEMGRFNDFDVRQAAWWSVLSGACGHTYGNNSIWQMWAPGRQPLWHARTPWYDAIHQPGARQMGILKAFMERHHWQAFDPDQTLLRSPNPAGEAHVRVAVSRERRAAILYLPAGHAVTLDAADALGDHLQWRWFNPRTGEYGENNAAQVVGELTLAPSTRGPGQDWVLIVSAQGVSHD